MALVDRIRWRAVDHFQRMNARRIAYAFVTLALLCVGIGNASAAPICGRPIMSEALITSGRSLTYPNSNAAVAACETLPAQAITTGGGGGWYSVGTRNTCSKNSGPKNVTVTYTDVFSFNESTCATTYPISNGPVRPQTGWVYTVESNCSSGEVDDPEHPGQCLDGQDCLNRNVGITGDGVRPWSSRCISGCNIAVTPGTSASTSANGGAPVWRGRFEYDGQVCSGGVVQNPDPDGTRTDEKTKPQECVPAGSGQTMCVKPTGENCYTASTGKQICWTPGETGKKSDGPIVQERKPGLVTPPDNMVLPNGDTANKTGTPTQTTTTKPGGSTVTTTTTNYVTTSGADGGSDNSGENGDGTGAPGGDGKENTSSGGATCGAPPISGGDQLLAQIAHQEWLQRCGPGKGDANGDGRPDWTEVTGMDTSLGQDRTGTEAWAAGSGEGEGFEPDASGFMGNRECKQPPDVTLPNGTVLHFDVTAFCNFLSIGSALVLLFAALACGKILGGTF